MGDSVNIKVYLFFQRPKPKVVFSIPLKCHQPDEDNFSFELLMMFVSTKERLFFKTGTADIILRL